MFHTTRCAPRTSRPSARLPLFFGLPGFLVVLLAGLLMGSASGTRVALAQNAPPIRVQVQTGSDAYPAGAAIRIRVTGTNPSDQPVTLAFRTGCFANYGFDGTAFDARNQMNCTADAPSVVLSPHETREFGAFVHTSDLFPLAPGRHELWAEVIGYGRASTVLIVNAPTPSDSLTYRMAPRVEPVVARPDQPIRFGLTVANASSTPRSFVVDGCPVQLSIDGWWSPAVACTDIARTITLAPGQSVDFSAADYPYLTYDPRQNSTGALSPGRHKALLGIRGVGSIGVEFAIADSTGGGGAAGGIRGVVADLLGEAVVGVRVSAATYGAGPDSLPPPPNGTVDPNPAPGFFASAVTGRDGHYLISSVPPGKYRVWATGADGGITWYNNVPYPEQATPVAVADAVVEGIDFTLKPGPPPPPPLPGVIEGNVFNWIPAGTLPPTRPIAGAVVVALFSGDPVDSTGPPRDSTNSLDGRAGQLWSAAGEPPPDGRPTLPPVPTREERYYGYTDDAGHYRIEVPFGAYRVVAGEVAHRYQWWEGSDGLAGAHRLIVDAAHPVARAGFGLKPLPADPIASLAGTVYAMAGRDSSGSGSNGDPATGVVPPDLDPTGRVLLEGAQVTALPLISDSRLMTPVRLFSAVTDAAGRFVLSVPANSPYMIQAAAQGYVAQFYDHTGDFWAAAPVDAAPGATTDGLDFDLGRDIYPPPPEGGILGGRVTTPDPNFIDADGRVGSVPVVDALVRVRMADPSYGPLEIVTRTDRQGFWWISSLTTGATGLAGGRYIVSAEAEGFVPTYYPAAYRAADAVPVEPMAPYRDSLPAVDISLARQPTDGTEFVAGRVRGTFNRGGVTPPNAGGTGAPFDSTLGEPRPLVGSFVYLIGLESVPTVEEHVLAGGVACDNGTLVLTGLPAGRYKAYADRPGYGLQWFGGSSSATATIFRLGGGSPGVLLDFTLEPLDGAPPAPGGGPGNGIDADAPMTNLRNAPNPSKPQTTIMYRLNSASAVSLRIFDVNGRLVRTLFENSPQSPGEQNVPWDGRSDEGLAVGAGMYFYQVQTAQKTATGKMVVVR